MSTELDLTEATAALGRLALGANYAHDVRILRLVIERLKALSAPPADAEVEAAARAMFEDGLGLPGDYTWAEMVTEDPSRADIWRADACRVLEAAREARS